MKKQIVLLAFIFGAFSILAQNHAFEVRNQEIIGNTFYFDVYLLGANQGEYLGNIDLVFPFASANFSAPIATLLPGYGELVNHSAGVDVSANYTIDIDIPTSGSNANEIIISVASPYVVNDLSTDVAYFETEKRIGRFSISNMIATNVLPNLSLKTKGGGTKTRSYYYKANFKQAAASYTFTFPSAGTAPSTVSNIDFVFNSPTSLSLNWDDLVGADGYLVLISDGDTLGNGPANTVLLDGNTSYNAANILGTGNDKVVYSDTSSGVTLSEMNSGNTYYIAIYAYTKSKNGFNEAYGSPVNLVIEPSLEPLNPPTNLTIDSVTRTGFRVHWTQGNAVDSALVVMIPQEMIGTHPSDGVSYAFESHYEAAGTELGNGYIVFNSADTMVTVSNLKVASQYTIAVYSFNHESGKTPNYLTSSVATLDKYTMFDEPNPLVGATDRIGSGTSFAANSSSSTQIDLSWTDPSNTDLQYLVVARLATDPATNPTAGFDYVADTAYGKGEALGNGFVVYNGDGTDLGAQITGFDQNENYVFDVYAYTGAPTFADTTTFNYDDAAVLAQGEATWVTVAVSAFLEGPYNGTNMDVNLTTILPTTDPYAGTETLASIPNDMVDWIQIELVNAASNKVAEAKAADYTRTGYLKADGTIVGTDGENLTFEITSKGEFFVKIRHRNHLPAMSNVKLAANGVNDQVFDFTSSAAYGANGTVDMGSGVLGLYAGNGNNADYTIDSDDFDGAWTNKGITTYSEYDVNLDSVVSASDRSVIYNNQSESSRISE